MRQAMKLHHEVLFSYFLPEKFVYMSMFIVQRPVAGRLLLYVYQLDTSLYGTPNHS